MQGVDPWGYFMWLQYDIIASAVSKTRASWKEALQFSIEQRSDEAIMCICVETGNNIILALIFVVPCIMLYIGEISPTRCNNCVFYSQWLYSTCIG